MRPQEEARLLEQMRGIDVAYPADATVNQLFTDIAAIYPDRMAVTADGMELSYRDLDEWSNRIGQRLLASGVPSGSIVGISAERTPAFIAGILGILKAGAAYLPLDPTQPASRISMILADADASALVLQDGSQIDCSEARIPQLALPIDPSFIEDWVSDPIPERTSADAVAYVLFTSGSTGRPKGVCIRHRGVARLVRNTDIAVLDPEQTFLQIAPTTFDVSAFDIWGSC